MATPVTITRPSAPTFQNPPLLEWQAIPGATDYDVVLSKAATPKIRIYDLSFRTGTSYQIPKALANGEYVFWVRAHLRTTGRPETVGIWSAPSNFSTISNPVITGPVGIDSNDPNVRTVTDSRPTVEWTPIDKAGRYEVWVERSDGLKPYLQTTSSTNSYRFEKDIQAGKYSVWVRAFSTTGEMTGWSPEYKFTATGGVPIITFPAQNENVAPIPDFTWTPVAEAKTYDIWIAWVGEDYDYIRTSGIALTSFAPTDPLPTGTYRVWVRAVKSDGTALGWSTPVDFTVVSSDVEQTATDFPELLAVLLPTAGDAQADSATDVTAQQAVEPTPEYSPAETDESVVATNTLLPNGESLLVATPEAEHIIQQLAEQCVSGEWWTPQNATT